MIYEKRGPGFRPAQSDIPDIRRDRKRTVVCQNTATGADAPKAEMPYAVKKRAGKARAKRVLCTLCAVLCVTVLDRYILDGKLMTVFVDGIKNAYESAPVENNRVTLYTRLVTAEPMEPTVTSLPKTEEHNTENYEAVTVGEVSGESFADGVKYFPITHLDLSADDIFSLTNETAFSPDVEYLANQTPAALQNINLSNGPLVLIVHTHGEECYSSDADMYPQNDTSRSTDISKNVVRVGEEIANTLDSFGIEALHCTKMHDSESFINAYSSSAKSVKEYLREYPSIKIVVDVHRDAIIRDDGESIAAVTEIAGEEYAQLMFVVGTNELGHNHPDWQDNLTLALNLQKSLDSTYPSLCRSINLRNVPFNQQLSSGYLLLETGTSANTLEQALRSARAFGENLARAVMMS